MWRGIFGPQPRSTLKRRREPQPVYERRCRAGCGRMFKLEFPHSPNAISLQTCNECLALLVAAMTAVHPDKSALDPKPKRLYDIETGQLFVRLRKHRAAFEGAWRLGADNKSLRAILESK
jgi:hypothetical protein